MNRILALLLLFTPPALAEALPDVSAHPPTWTLRESVTDPRAGYEIYSAKFPGSKFNVYRLEATFDASPEEVAAAALQNVVSNAPTARNIERKVLRRDGDVAIIHTLIRVPIIADSDIVTRVEKSHEPGSSIYRLDWIAIDSEGPPPRKGIRRITDSYGAWIFLPSGRGTRAIYESHTDIKGPVPAWIAKRMLKNSMVDQIVDLRRRVDASEIAPIQQESSSSDRAHSPGG